MTELVKLPQRGPVVPRDGLNRPMVVPETGGKPVAHTRTTTFIDCIEDKSNLVKWGKRMVLVGASVKPSLLEAVAKLDPTDNKDKRKLDALAEVALEAAGANDKREKGTFLHGLSEYVDEGKALPEGVSEADVADLMAYILATLPFTVRYAEKFVVINELGVGGTPDRVIDYDGPGPDGEPISGTFIGDLKTGTIEYGALKMASQLACYSRGKFYDFTRFPAPDRLGDPKGWEKWKKTVVPAEEAALAYTSMGDINQDWGIIFNLPSGSGEVTLHWVDLNKGWAAAKLALDIRAMRSTRKVMLPFVENSSTVEVDNAVASV